MKLCLAAAVLGLLATVQAARPPRFDMGKPVMKFDGLQKESNWTQRLAAEGTVNLDLPPEERWREVCGALKNESKYLEEYLMESVHVNAAEEKMIEKLGEILLENYGRDMRGEIKGCADALGVDFGLLMVLNLGYEVRRLGGGIHNTTGPCDDCMHEGQGGNMCTSIVARQPDGNIVHGRNLDWNIPADLRNFVMTVKFTQNGQHVFTGGTIVGYMGILTGLKPGLFSVSIDERGLGGDLLGNMIMAVTNKNSLQPSHLLRKTLMEASNYDEAVQMLSTAPLIAPVYYIIAGISANDGALLTRDRTKSVQPLFLDNNKWYLLQTNYDHWVQPPIFDDRRKYGLQYMNAIDPNQVNLEEVNGVLSKWPVRNDDTSQTILMNPLSSSWTFYIDLFKGDDERT
ncbi:N-acylethanolamine-hydrolyzing acid amidase [Chloropicon primus]|uniref:N-acylethanolamine-hydrolyzing acid amidase n=1 Tax=Chloropicon primus TaxID=1764295 RepID=A0A5B8MEL7_9CHLO|nr:N-acylethanolamine-hydrolyzing acid amidase [Chloropicon primus]UPQ98056.1 N-acylethanolamine-hydrolyzing acid amidase [Chloropicon primus]|eukprot:QDZ18849.1 N-acylethanolamine-hydrolyzing acid amidase [Chloropicon primus]